MDHLIYTAVNGAVSTMRKQALHANNLANINTQGFRGDIAEARSDMVNGAGHKTRYMPEDLTSGVDMKPGQLVETGNPLDVAIEGDGLFTLRQGDHEVYTRNGAIQADQDGNLTIDGLPVEGDGGPITLPPYSQIFVGTDGTISVIPQEGTNPRPIEVDRLKLVVIPVNQLKKDEQGHLVGNTPTTQRSEDVRVVNKHLESSNVSSVGEMVATISLNRQFEAQVKLMKIAEQLAQTGNQLIHTN